MDLRVCGFCLGASSLQRAIRRMPETLEHKRFSADYMKAMGHVCVVDLDSAVHRYLHYIDQHSEHPYGVVPRGVTREIWQDDCKKGLQKKEILMSPLFGVEAILLQYTKAVALYHNNGVCG